MLLYLADYLSQYHSGFSVFQYLTLRAILGVLTALIISFVVGPEMIRRLGRYQMRLRTVITHPLPDLVTGA